MLWRSIMPTNAFTTAIQARQKPMQSAEIQGRKAKKFRDDD
ncbi:hypothetical protein SAMN05421839_10453 [Halolactibacillus halophilus]|uniref:Uncharacterized protein n=1 Tax=Halolactibacillus halophilus TaxID=306540 RepID=A0A1I5M6K9_9BACI|nr:hypothetical protein [Halolactibacillus halophilus]GEM01035.1 hypothetical protein HHA03_05670 [Halolactibacillus halophilus]SFP05155.1 hypothetical protein SAMN05421839_10453 [Halolactibacillus halophilus]